MGMSSAFAYFGGKNLLARRLVHLIPPHVTYVEAFGGSAALLFAKQPSKVEIYNDVDMNLINFFRVLRSLECSKVLQENMTHTPYSRQEYYNFIAEFNSLEEVSADVDLNRAYLWYYIQLCGFSGVFGGSWSASGVRKVAESYLNTIRRLPNLQQRFEHVHVENDSFEQILYRYDNKNAFFYLDPPYVASTRKSGEYKNELSDDDHKRLMDIITCPLFESKVMLSGYRNELYDNALSSWSAIDFEGMPCPAVGRTKTAGTTGEGAMSKKYTRTETIWINYKTQQGINQLSLL